MGMWSSPNTVEGVAELKALLGAPLKASVASEKLYEVFGCDSLFDTLHTATEVDPSADVRSLVINRLDQVYFTHRPVGDMCSEPVAAGLREIVDGFILTDGDIFDRIKQVGDEAAALGQVKWATDKAELSDDAFQVVKDLCGMDYVVWAPDGHVYRVEAVDGCVSEFNPALAERHAAAARVAAPK